MFLIVDRVHILEKLSLICENYLMMIIKLFYYVIPLSINSLIYIFLKNRIEETLSSLHIKDNPNIESSSIHLKTHRHSPTPHLDSGFSRSGQRGFKISSTLSMETRRFIFFTIGTADISAEFDPLGELRGHFPGKSSGGKSLIVGVHNILNNFSGCAVVVFGELHIDKDHNKKGNGGDTS